MSSNAVEQIKNRLSVVDVISAYVELKPAGKNLKGKSPFTNEKTPSFFVSPDRGMYFCFSSQKGGDMFTFIQEMEGVDFKGALKILAEKAGVALVQEDPRKRSARETQYALLEDVAQFFELQLKNHPSIDSYIQSRGVSSHTMRVWRIGYAPDDWRALRTYLSGKGYTDHEMLSAGVIKQTDTGKDPYDVFRDRVMFPLYDPSSRVVAFSGRTMKSDAAVPKYVNSPETELFQKSEILYGYHKAKQGIRQYDFSLVVEGQFDVVLSHQAGYVNTVAVSGTAFTPHHRGLLMRISKNVVLALDADRAGLHAMKRSALPMLESGMDVKVAALPEGADPADVVRQNPHDLKKYVGGAVHIIEFLLDVHKKNAKDERAYKLHVYDEVLPLIAVIENRIDREHFEGVVAEALRTTKDGIHYEVERLVALRTSRGMSTHNETTASSIRITHNDDEKRRLELHIRASLEAVRTQHQAVYATTETLIQDMRYAAFLEPITQISLTECSGDIFQLEQAYADWHDERLLSEFEYMFSRYLHISARETLRALRDKMIIAEKSGDTDVVLALLQETKNAEAMLKQNVTLPRL